MYLKISVNILFWIQIRSMLRNAAVVAADEVQRCIKAAKIES
jgi:hypothetical protein